MNEKQFTGKVAFVTGATSGIGQACAIAFANSGAKVVCVGRKTEALNDVEKKIREIGAEVLTIQADVSDVQEVERAVNLALKKFGGIDVLVNAAGHISNGTIENTSLDAWDEFAGVGDVVAATGLGRVELMAPFTPTLPGTERYVDELRA